MRRALLLSALAALVIVPATMAAGSPSVQTLGTTAVKDNSATVLGTVNPNGQPTKYEFKYGTTTEYGTNTAQIDAGSGTTVKQVSAALTGLLPGTTYHYQILALAKDGSTATGTDQTFKTTGNPPPPPPAKPSATTGAPTAVSTGGATVSGTVNPNGVATSYYFEFGTSSSYGFQTPPAPAGNGTANVSVTATLAGLRSNQIYHYRVVAVSLGGLTPGADATFKTSSTGSRLSLFGHTGFVSPEGVGGVFLGCLGQSPCSGSLTITRSGVVIGQRSAISIGSQDGGIAHLTLNSLGQSLLASRHHLGVTVSVTDSTGQTSTGAFTLVHFQ